MNDFLLQILKHPFTWGLIAGLIVAGFVWKAGFTAGRQARREQKRLSDEIRELQTHLNTQLKINSTGNATLLQDLESLKQQNENLRVANSSLQQKPGRAELRQLGIYEAAIRAMREQAPGFAPAWEKALRHAEIEAEKSTGGFTKMIRNVIPGLGTTTPTLEIPDEPK
ncbi:MAG: hypothetical protein QM627_02950 [Luteolibacter sp.]